MFEERGSNSMLQQVLINHATAKRGACTQHPKDRAPQLRSQQAGTPSKNSGVQFIFRAKNYPFASGKSNGIFNVQP